MAATDRRSGLVLMVAARNGLWNKYRCIEVKCASINARNTGQCPP